MYELRDSTAEAGLADDVRRGLNVRSSKATPSSISSHVPPQSL